MFAKHADGIGYRRIPKLLNAQVSHNPDFFFTLNGHDQVLTTQDSIAEETAFRGEYVHLVSCDFKVFFGCLSTYSVWRTNAANRLTLI